MDVREAVAQAGLTVGGAKAIPRAAAALVKDALADTPVVLIHGPRQAGKTTLAYSVAEELGSFQTMTMDDAFSRSFALDTPAEFVASLPGPCLIDEVQRTPGIFLPIKASVDRDRRPGRFLLTGSSNILALPKLADSLAGRMAIIDLLPLSQAEIESHPARFIDAVFGEGPLEYDSSGIDEGDLIERLLRGGFPEARSRASDIRRDAWYRDYVRTLLERDVQDIDKIASFRDLPKVLELLSSRTGAALNEAGISRDANIPQTSLHRYLDLLRAVFLTHYVPPWSSNRGTRLIKAPKVYLLDTGLMAYVENITADTLRHAPTRLGTVLESFVAMELKKLAGLSFRQPSLHHLRTVKHLEVDFVLEARGGQLVGIDVIASKTVQSSDADGLKYLKELAPDKFRRGIVLYLGNAIRQLAPDIAALPIDALWRT